MIILTSVIPSDLQLPSVQDNSVFSVILNLFNELYEFLSVDCSFNITPNWTISLWQILFYPFVASVIFAVAKLILMGGKD